MSIFKRFLDCFWIFITVVVSSISLILSLFLSSFSINSLNSSGLFLL